MRHSKKIHTPKSHSKIMKTIKENAPIMVCRSGHNKVTFERLSINLSIVHKEQIQCLVQCAI